MKIEKYSNALYKQNGVYVSSTNREISYPSHGNNKCYEIEDQSFWFKHRNRVIGSLIKNFNTEDVFFDVGAGNGYISHYLQNNSVDAIMLEPGLDGVINAKQRNIQNIIHSTFEDAKIKANSLPNIGVFDVIEHIDKDLDFMQMMNTSLIPGGYVFVTVPAHKYLWSENDIRAGHYRRYTIKTMTTLLSKCNFKIEYISYFFSMLPLPILINRTLPHLLGVKSKDHNKKSIKEHAEKDNLSSKIFKKLATNELKKIQAKKSLYTGSSLCVVAKKL